MKSSPLIVIIILLFILSGCAAEPVVSPREYYNILLLSKDFLAFCIFLINSEPKYHKQIISRIYYCYFTLARYVHIRKTDTLDRVKHTVIWSQNKVKPRKKYGEFLKKRRVFYDYDFDSMNVTKEELNNDLKFIIENKNAFNELIVDSKKQMIEFYKYKDPSLIEESNSVFNDIEKMHKELEKGISKVISES